MAIGNTEKRSRIIRAEEKKLLVRLRSEDEQERIEATGKLWDLWFSEKGRQAEERLREGTALMESGRIEEAEIFFSRMLDEYPDFPEVYNKRATAYYLQQKYGESIIDCETVVHFNPNHFGSWHGLGLCHIDRGRFDSALIAFQHALRIQPYADANRKYIRICLSKLN
jgi:tetratricopeptide (TPR) repeat protein